MQVKTALTVSHAEMTEPIEMLFGGINLVGSGNHVSDKSAQRRQLATTGSYVSPILTYLPVLINVWWYIFWTDYFVNK